jgi:hypothetical protein
MPLMARGLSGERIEKIPLHNICNNSFNKFLTIPLGIVVSALAFHNGDRGSIPCLQGNYRVELLHREIPVVITGNEFT